MLTGERSIHNRKLIKTFVGLMAVLVLPWILFYLSMGAFLHTEILCISIRVEFVCCPKDGLKRTSYYGVQLCQIECKCAKMHPISKYVPSVTLFWVFVLNPILYWNMFCVGTTCCEKVECVIASWICFQHTAILLLLSLCSALEQNAKMGCRWNKMYNPIKYSDRLLVIT